MYKTNRSKQAKEEKKKKEKKTLGTEVVNIVQSYKPSISKSSKQSLRPDVSDIQDAERKTVDYTIFSVPVASTFQPQKGSAANLKRARKPKYFNNYARLGRSEEHTSELQSRGHLVCRLLLEKKK